MTYDFVMGAVWALVLVLVGFLIGLLVMAYANWWGPNGPDRDEPPDFVPDDWTGGDRKAMTDR